MNQLTFVVLTSVIVFGMFALGWIAGVIHHRLRRGSAPDPKTIERLVSDLAVVEHERDRCVETLRQYEQQVAEKLAERDELYRKTIDRLRDAELRLNKLDNSR